MDILILAIGIYAISHVVYELFKFFSFNKHTDYVILRDLIQASINNELRINNIENAIVKAYAELQKEKQEAAPQDDKTRN